LSTRQDIQHNWPALERVPDITNERAEVDMHAIQTSGTCIRNTTVDHFAGVAPSEVLNPLMYAEIIRRWCTLHPEFTFLPRKFKIAISGSPEDTAAVMVHDVGLNAVFDYDGRPGFTVVVGGGLGRTPIVGHVIREFLPAADLLTYLDAILRVYNMHGRRDNKYYARIKSLVNELGVAELRRQVEHEWSFREGGPGTLTADEIACPGGDLAMEPFRNARERLSTQGFEPIASTSQQFLEFQEKEFVLYERLIREGKIRIEQ